MYKDEIGNVNWIKRYHHIARCLSHTVYSKTVFQNKQQKTHNKQNYDIKGGHYNTNMYQ